MRIVLGATSAAQWVSAVSAAVGLLLAAPALFFAGLQVREQSRQVREQSRTARAQFYLMLDGAFRDHKDTYRKFAPSDQSGSQTVGIWHGPDAQGPASAEEWMDTHVYIGLLERVNVLIDWGLLDADTIKRLRGHRVRDILSNRRVLEELKGDPERWRDFIALAEKLDLWPDVAAGQAPSPVPPTGS